MNESDILFLLERSCASLAFKPEIRKKKAVPLGHILGQSPAQ
ncbi:MAG: hypothetical protein ACRERY_14905 [Pseudomonas sp.]